MDFLDRFLPFSLRQNPRSLRLARLIVGTCGILSCVLSLTLAARLVIGPLAPAALALALISIAGFTAVPFLLHRSASLWIAGWLTTCIFLVLCVTQMVLAGGPNAPVAVLLPLIPLLATHLVGPGTGRWTAGILVAAVAAVVVLQRLGFQLPRRNLNAEEDLLAHGLLLIVATLLVTLLTVSFEHQRKLLEGELRQTDALYRRLFDQTKDMVALTKPSGRLIDVNQAGVDLDGFPSREAFLKADLRSLYIHPEQREELVRQLEEHGFVRNYESHQIGPDGKARIVQGTTTAVRDGRGRISHYLAILRDVTEERRAAQERERIVRELERKNRDLESFSYAVSHDLKSPLFTIRGFLELLRDDAQSGDFEQVLEDLDHILRTTEQMQVMVDGLLLLAQVGTRRESWTSQPLTEIAREVVELLAGRLRQNEIEIRIDPDLPFAYGDRILLTRLLQNLIDNAAKFLEGREAPWIEVGCRLDGEKQVIFVRDNGPGIALPDQEKIFGLFSKLNKEAEGTGVGLALVKKVVEIHGGEVWVESDGPGQGATFYFTLPAKASPV